MKAAHCRLRRGAAGSSVLLAAFALPAAAAAQAPPHAEVRSGLDAVALFRLADEAKAEGRFADAETLLKALAHDPDPEIRAEGRFRLGLLLSDLNRYEEAALVFRALLDEKPDAPRVRIELARILARIGDEAGARKELRQAQAAGLPSDVAVVVDQFVAALRSTKPFGGSFEVALAPSTNINRATDATTLDTVIAPLTLDSDAQARSGLGLDLRGQAYGRVPVSDSVAILGRLSASADLYRESRFDDVSAALVAGPEISLGRDRLRPALGLTYRFYGGDPYARTQSISADWLHPLGRKAQLSVQASANRARYSKNALQDGYLYDGAVTYERAFSASFGGSLSLSANRQTAVDPGYSTVSGGLSALLWRESGRTTFFASLSLRRLEADARLFPFTDRRSDTFVRAGAGAVLRRFTFREFAPVVRISWERNASTVGLYDYKRTNIEFGLSRAF